MAVPDLSIIIPVYNRGELIRYTLESVLRASVGLSVETIVIDDGSATPVAADLARLGYAVTQVYRQENRGLLFARLAGLARATGRYTVFLDSDDLVGPEKFRAQISALLTHHADVSYTDTAQTVVDGDYDRLVIVPDAPAADTASGPELFISIQPPPHSPIFRTDYLRDLVTHAFMPPSPLYNSVAEIWFYHIAAPFPARVVKVPGPHTIVGRHAGTRLTGQWEKLGVASLAVMEAFARHCPVHPDTQVARRLVGEKAFGSWRRLPSGFSPEFSARLLTLWRRLPNGELVALGGGAFQSLARLVGPALAGRLFRLRQARPYASVRTLGDEEFVRLLRALPAP